MHGKQAMLVGQLMEDDCISPSNTTAKTHRSSLQGAIDQNGYMLLASLALLAYL